MTQQKKNEETIDLYIEKIFDGIHLRDIVKLFPTKQDKKFLRRIWPFLKNAQEIKDIEDAQ